MNTIQDRLQIFLAESGIAMQKFERQCGIGQGLGSKLSTKSYATTFKRISDAFPQLNIDWLKTGEGEMLKANYTQTINGGEKIVQHGSINIQGEAQAGNDMLSALLRTQDLLAQSLQTITQIQATQAATQATQARLLEKLMEMQSRK